MTTVSFQGQGGGLPHAEWTLASVLEQAKYNTYFTGKWHWASEAYGIAPEHMVGTEEKLKYAMRDGKPVLIREPGFDFIDDGAGKPVGIFRAIGQRPILAFGNSDDDREMLEYTTGGAGPSLGLLLHHDDPAREFAYDRNAGSARLDKAWDEAQTRGWIVVSMKQDWKTVYPAQKANGQ